MVNFGIGAAVRREEEFRFLTGQGTYTDDINQSVMNAVVDALVPLVGYESKSLVVKLPAHVAVRSFVRRHIENAGKLF